MGLILSGDSNVGMFNIIMILKIFELMILLIVILFLFFNVFVMNVVNLGKLVLMVIIVSLMISLLIFVILVIIVVLLIIIWVDSGKIMKVSISYNNVMVLLLFCGNLVNCLWVKILFFCEWVRWVIFSIRIINVVVVKSKIMLLLWLRWLFVSKKLYNIVMINIKGNLWCKIFECIVSGCIRVVLFIISKRLVILEFSILLMVIFVWLFSVVVMDIISFGSEVLMLIMVILIMSGGILKECVNIVVL